MKKSRTVLFILAALIVLTTAVACDSRQEVKIYRNEAPDEKKPIGDDSVQAEKTPAPSIDSTAVYTQFGDESMTVYNRYNDIVIPYDKVEEYMYMQSFNYEEDTLKDGIETSALVCALMETEASEEYTLCIYRTTASYIAIYFKGQQIVFNLESDEKTKDCYDTLKEKMLEVNADVMENG